MDVLKNAFGADRPTEGNQQHGDRTNQVERSEQGRNEQGESGGGFLEGLGDKFGGGNQQGHRNDGGQRNEQGGGGGGFLGGIGNKINSAAGGGPESEKNEDYLDKGRCLGRWIILLSSIST